VPDRPAELRTASSSSSSSLVFLTQYFVPFDEFVAVKVSEHGHHALLAVLDERFPFHIKKQVRIILMVDFNIRTFFGSGAFGFLEWRLGSSSGIANSSDRTSSILTFCPSMRFLCNILKQTFVLIKYLPQINLTFSLC
jgi:hypothetical protein